MTDLLGRPLRSLEGSVVDWSRDTLFLGLISATEWGRPWDSVDTLRVGLNELASIEEKHLDPWRTGLLVVGGSAVVGATVVALFQAAGSDEGGRNEEPPDRILIPLLSFRH